MTTLRDVWPGVKKQDNKVEKTTSVKQVKELKKTSPVVVEDGIVEEAKVVEPVEVEVPDVKKILAELQVIKKQVASSMTKEQIDAELSTMSDMKAQITNLKKILDGRIKKSGALIDAKEMEARRNIEEKEGFTEVLGEINDTLATIKEKGNPELNIKSVELSKQKENLENYLDAKAQTESAEYTKRANELRNMTSEIYNNQIAELESKIRQIENNPTIVAQLSADMENVRLKKEKQMMELRSKTVSEMNTSIDKILSANSKSFIAITEALKDDIFAKFKECSSEKEVNSLSDSVKSRIMNLILIGEGKDQIQSPNNLVPWKMPIGKGYKYQDMIFFLKENSNIQSLKEHIADQPDQTKRESLQNGLLKKHEAGLEENEFLFKIFGPEYSPTKEGKYVKNPFWAAFDKRAENDKNGTTQKMIAEKKSIAEEQRQIDKKLRDIVEKGGFMCTIPDKGKNIRAAILLEKTTTRDGNQTLYKVTDVSSSVSSAFVPKIGTAYTEKTLPKYIREKALFAGRL